jgi:hypothetical protein
MHSRETLGPNQVCTVFGSTPGNDQILGRSYLDASYSLHVSDIWRRNFVVLVGFFVFFLCAQVVAIEWVSVCMKRHFVRLEFALIMTDSNTSTTHPIFFSFLKTLIPGNEMPPFATRRLVKTRIVKTSLKKQITSHPGNHLQYKCVGRKFTPNLNAEVSRTFVTVKLLLGRALITMSPLAPLPGGFFTMSTVTSNLEP